MTKAELYEKAKSLPALPGVYIIRDKNDNIIYIGKAKRLRTRVSQYFRDGSPLDDKTHRMVSVAYGFDIIVTSSEFEALVLECSQIKAHRPKYNILLKDDKGYRYIKLTKDEWPRISAEKQKTDDGATYIGPYMSGYAVNQMVQSVLDSFLLPRCTRNFPRDFGKQRPCLYSHIGKCKAWCTGKIPLSVYSQTIQNSMALIRQNDTELLKLLTQQMSQASEQMDYERAAVLRDQIAAIRKIGEKQVIIKSGDQDIDIIAFAKSHAAACASILRFRGGVLCDKREFIFHDTNSIDALCEEFIPRYYLEDDSDIPRVIATDVPLPDKELLMQLLSEKSGVSVRIYTPKRGDVRKLVETTYINAVERLAREGGRTRKEEKVLDELAGLLCLSGPPLVIESYDISNWGDGSSVCGMVVFQNGKPHKAGYRRFQMKTVSGTDDYASISEALLRRAAEFDSGASGQFGVKPDLILLDGGRGQVSAGAHVLQNTGLSDVPLFGMVKDNKHRTRGIIAKNGSEITLSMHRGPFTFITGIQDETHRFAISYQRKKAKGKAFASTLTTISGVGPATAKALMTHFKTLRAISCASIDDLSAAKGVTRTAAKAVYQHFHDENI